MPTPFSQTVTPDVRADPADRFRELSRGEQLALWSVRAVALGYGDSPGLHRTLHIALGASATDAFAALFITARTLGGAVARPLHLHAPGCDGVSEDERWLLALFAEAQHALLTGDERRVRRSLAQAVEPRLVEGLLMTLQAVGAALEVNGYALPLREDAPAAPRPRRLH